MAQQVGPCFELVLREEDPPQLRGVEERVPFFFFFEAPSVHDLSGQKRLIDCAGDVLVKAEFSFIFSKREEDDRCRLHLFFPVVADALRMGVIGGRFPQHKIGRGLGEEFAEGFCLFHEGRFERLQAEGRVRSWRWRGLFRFFWKRGNGSGGWRRWDFCCRHRRRGKRRRSLFFLHRRRQRRGCDKRARRN